MSRSTDERLYNLLPATYRVRDVGQGEPLRALLAIIEGEMDLIEHDIDGLYEDWFIETCAEWAVPYIADLLGVRHLHNVESADIFSQRAYVANTLRYRRRKGTTPVLEQLARDVTGWPARAVEFFEHLITNQHVNHVRQHNVATPDLRDANQLELLGGPFERAAHTVEVRRIVSQRGRYNIPNIGLFLWRLQEYVVIQSTPRAATEPADGRYRFSPLGNDIPLFNRPETETEITHLAEEVNVPGRLRRRALYDDLEALRQALVDEEPAPRSTYLDTDPAFQIFVSDGAGGLDAIPPEEVLICDLSDTPGTADWRSPPSSKTYTSRTRLDESVDPPVPLEVVRPIRVAVDPELGRLAFPEDVVPARVAVSYTYGFSSDVGGGPYSRQEHLARATSLETWTATVAQHDPEADHTTLTDALADWAAGDAEEGILTVTDSGTYAEALTVEMASERNLVIQAADHRRPTLRLLSGGPDLGELLITGGDGAETTLALNGFWIEGGIRIEADSLESLNLMHCTLVPGRGLDAGGDPRRPELASLVVELPNADLQVDIDRCIVGPLRVHAEIANLSARDSIIDSPLHGGPARYTPALVSGSLSTFPTLTAATPAVEIQIGAQGPHTATLAEVPTTLAQARDLLQAAIRAAHDSLAFARAQVISATGRLIVLAGTPEQVDVQQVEDDPTSAELRLTDGSEVRVQALVTPALSPFPALSAPVPALNVTMGGEGPHTISLTPAPTTVAQARDQLHNTIRTAHSDSAFQNAIVGSADDRIVILPGTAETTVRFGVTADDETTLVELGLNANRPALAADDIGHQPGPRTSLERVTVLGSVQVRELALASETIFAEPVVAQRRQTGCTRFCFVPAGSQVPRRYRCQPDLALAAYARELGKSVDALSEAERTVVLTRVTPTFTSTQYGDPAYAQLSQTCPEEIHTGAEDGAELGAFNHLQRPQREANLRASLESYLRYGLHAGIFFVT